MDTPHVPQAVLETAARDRSLLGPRHLERKPDWIRTGIEFTPAHRGDLDTALSDEEALARVAPETPRPVELVEDIKVVGDDRLTAADQALHELLIAVAFEADPDMKIEEHTVDIDAVLTYLGEHTRRQHLERMLDRLRDTHVVFNVSIPDRRFGSGRAPLILPWTTGPEGGKSDTLHFSLPIPIRRLMSGRWGRYTYIELAPLARMKSKYGARLYKRLALTGRSTLKESRPASGDSWEGYTIEAAPEEVAYWVGYKPGGAFDYGTFRRRCLIPALEDVQLSRRFTTELEEKRGKRRGAPVDRLVFSIWQKPLLRTDIRTKAIDNAALMKILSLPDRSDLTVSAGTFLRAMQYHGIGCQMLAEGWRLALHEAMEGIEYDEKAKSRMFRGERLLAEIERVGADDAAWSFFNEELARPSSILGRFIATRADHGRAADEARQARHKAEKAKETASDDAPVSLPAPVASQQPAAALAATPAPTRPALPPKSRNPFAPASVTVTTETQPAEPKAPPAKASAGQSPDKEGMKCRAWGLLYRMRGAAETKLCPAVAKEPLASVQPDIRAFAVDGGVIGYLRARAIAALDACRDDLSLEWLAEEILKQHTGDRDDDDSLLDAIVAVEQEIAAAA